MTRRSLNELEDRIQESLLGGLIEHYRAVLAAKHRHRRLARWCRWQRMLLERGLIVALLCSAYTTNERRRVFGSCRTSVQRHDLVVRAVVTKGLSEELRLAEMMALEDEDRDAYWARVAAMMETCLGGS